MHAGYRDIDDYISGFPLETRELLEQLRTAIKKAAPEAQEAISYNMPAFRLNGILVYFAGYSKHIGFYPTGKGIEAFKEELSDYKWSKGTIQFSLNKSLPVDLISRIVKFRVNENMRKVKIKKKKPV